MVVVSDVEPEGLPGRRDLRGGAGATQYQYEEGTKGGAAGRSQHGFHHDRFSWVKVPNWDVSAENTHEAGGPIGRCPAALTGCPVRTIFRSWFGSWNS